jgi:hypothetical protein
MTIGHVFTYIGLWLWGHAGKGITISGICRLWRMGLATEPVMTRRAQLRIGTLDLVDQQYLYINLPLPYIFGYGGTLQQYLSDYTVLRSEQVWLLLILIDFGGNLLAKL